jgi:hypothetical protein
LPFQEILKHNELIQTGGIYMRPNFKKTSTILILTLVSMLVVSCRTTPAPTTTPTPTLTATPTVTATATATATATGTATAPATETEDAQTTASIVNNAEAFEKAIGPNGSWIICLLNDLAINKDLVLEGEYKNGKKDADGKDVIQRKIALYEQDADRKVTARYTLTAPKLTITSPNARIQSGTFKGDLYVNVEKFQLVDATVEGNVYFASEDIKKSFTMDATSKVTGKQEVKK